jgi:DNA-binding transcriptional LysR family regulator
MACSIELGVTQGAVSRSIRAVEQQLGILLFERTGHGAIVTQSGQQFVEHIRRALGEIDAGVIEVARYREGSEQLTVAVVPAFASRWLAPRLAGFARLHPDVTLHLISRSERFAFDDMLCDAAIGFGAEAWPGAICDPLIEVEMVVAAAPSLVGTEESDERLWGKLPLLQHSLRPHAWRDWFVACGVSHPRPLAGHVFDSYALMIEAAVAGLGLVLARDLLVAADLAGNRLVQIGRRRQLGNESYVLAYPSAKRTNPTLQRFRAWLTAEVRLCRQTRQQATSGS